MRLPATALAVPRAAHVAAGSLLDEAVGAGVDASVDAARVRPLLADDDRARVVAPEPPLDPELGGRRDRGPEEGRDE